MKSLYSYIIFLAISGILIITLAVVTQNKNGTSTSTSKYNTATTTKPGTVKATTTNPASSKSYTQAQVALHGSASDCWSIVSGKVYDLTSWISQHPGGEREIIRMCGIDATSAYLGQHGGQSKPEAILASFEIGTVSN